MKKSSVYTRTGDEGMTSLVGGERVSKTCARLESYGTVDELNSHLGLLQAELPAELDADVITTIQCHLFSIGSQLATADPDKLLPKVITEAEVEWIEHLIDATEDGLPGWRGFILPGGSHAAAQAHVCRCVCRRAERRIYALAQEAPVDALLLAYMNRLSDYLFVLAKKINHLAGIEENIWRKR